MIGLNSMPAMQYGLFLECETENCGQLRRSILLLAGHGFNLLNDQGARTSALKHLPAGRRRLRSLP
jgi:hypothetical protein